MKMYRWIYSTFVDTFGTEGFVKSRWFRSRKECEDDLLEQELDDVSPDSLEFQEIVCKEGG